MSALESAIRGGQPSTTTPIPPPCDSPKVVTRKSWPKVLPMRACHFDRADESLNSRKHGTTEPAPGSFQRHFVYPERIRQSSPSCRLLRAGSGSDRGISNHFSSETESRDVSTSLDMTKKCAQSRVFLWGAHAASRADFGASPKSSCSNKTKSWARRQRQHGRRMHSPEKDQRGPARLSA